MQKIHLIIHSLQVTVGSLGICGLMVTRNTGKSKNTFNLNIFFASIVCSWQKGHDSVK